MKTASPNELDSQALADEEAVLRHILEGTPVPEDVSRRVDDRAERITERIRLMHGDIDIGQLLRDVRNEA